MYQVIHVLCVLNSLDVFHIFKVSEKTSLAVRSLGKQGSSSGFHLVWNKSHSNNLARGNYLRTWPICFTNISDTTNKQTNKVHSLNLQPVEFQQEFAVKNKKQKKTGFFDWGVGDVCSRGIQSEGLEGLEEGGRVGTIKALTLRWWVDTHWDQWDQNQCFIGRLLQLLLNLLRQDKWSCTGLATHWVLQVTQHNAQGFNQ